MLAIFMINLLYICLIAAIYFSKESVENYDNKLYRRILVITIIGLLIDIIQYCAIKYGFPNFCILVFNKLFLVYINIWTFLFTCYVFNIGNKDFKYKDGFLYRFTRFSFITFIVLGLLLPIHYYHNNQIIYSYGLAANVTYFAGFFYSAIMIIVMIFNYRSVDSASKKKYVPMFLFLLLGFLEAIVQIIRPDILLLSSLETFVTILTFFFIENPDVKMLEQMELAKDQAEKANRAKTDFLSSMSHEIRTPLNAIVGFSDCIMDASSLGEAKENAKDIVNASQTLLEIVNGILDISKIEAGKLDIINTPYNAHETFEELAKLITPKMHEKGLDFTYSIAPDLPTTLFGDHANIKKIVTNLLSNACKYTERGYVHYEVNCVNANGVSKLIISVEDSGRGIKKENIDKLFTKFQRLDEDRNTTIEGTGLGLAITKQLIELMGGRIIVHTVYGEGSKFTVVLNQKIEANEVEEKKHVKTTLDLHDVRILMVDDTPLNLKVGCKLLERYNANHIVTCDSGFECIERIQRGEVYDLILLDDMMPRMSGVETLKKLKEIPGFKIPTVALTANAITGMREKYLADGFDDYLAKPIEKEQLIQVVNQILGRSMTEEINVQKVNESNSATGTIRDDEIISVENMEKDSSSFDNNGIIPVEEDKVEMLENQDTENVKEESPIPVDVLEGINPNPVVDLVPVVDLNVGGVQQEGYDRSYLEKNGVDVNHALELLGDMDMYNMTISDFMKEVEDKWKRIVEYRNSNNMPDYAIEVHSLKSDCKYLGFMTLADIAYQHELKSKENDLFYVQDHFAELEEEYKKVLEIARKYVENNPVSE